jgi:hypothetical protein
VHLTKKNHYNPCFWTANWNSAYLERVIRGTREYKDVRSQKVWVLNVKADKIVHQAVDQVHYDKNFGWAEITPDGMKAFCKRHFPEDYENISAYVQANPEHLLLDIENILTGLESTPAYTCLPEIIRKGRIDSMREKGELASFLLMQHHRGHGFMNAMVEMSATADVPKFEYFWMFKHSLSNTDLMFKQVLLLTTGRWKFYRLDKETFPLTDTPVLIQPHSVMAALSPRLLLEIDRTDHSCENGWSSANSINPTKLDEFRHRTINNTFREIIFGSKALLEEWQQSVEFRQRHELMANTRTYNQKVREYLGGEIWKVNAYANSNQVG